MRHFGAWLRAKAQIPAKSEIHYKSLAPALPFLQKPQPISSHEKILLLLLYANNLHTKIRQAIPQHQRNEGPYLYATKNACLDEGRVLKHDNNRDRNLSQGKQLY